MHSWKVTVRQGQMLDGLTRLYHELRGKLAVESDPDERIRLSTIKTSVETTYAYVASERGPLMMNEKLFK